MDTYVWAAGGCRSCCQLAADTYGISPDDAGFAFTAKKNINAYFQSIPGSSKLDPRTMVRILLIYLGIPVTSPTEQENGGAEYLHKRKGGQ